MWLDLRMPAIVGGGRGGGGGGGVVYQRQLGLIATVCTYCVAKCTRHRLLTDTETCYLLLSFLTVFCLPSLPTLISPSSFLLPLPSTSLSPPPPPQLKDMAFLCLKETVMLRLPIMTMMMRMVITRQVGGLY